MFTDAAVLTATTKVDDIKEITGIFYFQRANLQLIPQSQVPINQSSFYENKYWQI